jgi:holo-[acyl-carrier protein] synthase
MILGTGMDTVDIRRIEKSLARFGSKFEKRLFTPVEQTKAQRRKGGARNGTASTYAKRFAAKEAMAKALGTGFHQGVYHKDMGVVNLPSGKPTMALTGQAQQHLHALTPPKHEAIIHVSLGDEYPYATAWVIIEARPL